MNPCSTSLQVVKVKDVPSGTDQYETLRAATLDKLAVKVPSDLVLTPSLILNPSTDVSGIPETCGLLTAREIEITENYSAVGLAKAIASKDLTAVEVATSFAKRAIIAHQLTCCLTQWLMNEAILRAKELDDYMEKNGKPIGPHRAKGSIRGPSAFCGIYGFKATSDTLPMKDFLRSPFAAERPMCRKLEDMDLLVRVVKAAQPWLHDASLVPIPWTGFDTAMSRPLQIGIIENDGFIVPQPPVRRAIEWARARLGDPKFASLWQVKPFRPYNAEGAWRNIRRMYWPDGGASTKAAIQESGEPVMPLSAHVWSDAEPFGMLTAEELNQLRFQRDQFRHRFAASWSEQDVDVVIGPAFVGPASAHDTAFYWTYTSLYNFVDYPGAVFPTPIKAKSSETYPLDYSPLSAECEHVKKLWSESNFEGAPIDLQIVARRHQDNILFGALNLLKPALDLP
ncbi:hypothetical protein E8E13_011058 [Curvularia kusanoi]|uniref:Amidase domain-containing protein n=1 Tax=Curvularia kusanoi TaxID=90978 RepID=A0A9P4TJB0_CURKU|nr:hypothetical protein E8E13_011058 [Curvularia kusanoi]